jgi:hypothetical protein
MFQIALLLIWCINNQLFTVILTKVFKTKYVFNYCMFIDEKAICIDLFTILL